MYFHQKDEWPNFKWDTETLINYLSEARELQGKLLANMSSLGFELQDEAILQTITDDVVKSSEIEGELLNSDEVRSSVAKRLGIEISGLPNSSRDVDGIVEVMLDATQNYSTPLTKERLFGWHAALFPTGRSGMNKITVANWRKSSGGPMQVVSGPLGKEKVHFEAPNSERLENEMNLFIEWFNSDDTETLIKSAIAHLWFVSIHPFDDGNGRIARALGDKLLACADKTKQRFYSMSTQIMESKKQYYNILEYTQKGSLDITQWLVWYLERLINALKSTEVTLSRVLDKARFWEHHRNTHFNERQIKILNLILGDFEGKLNTSKWAKITKVHRDTALKDIKDLVSKGVLNDSDEGGRSTNYILNLTANKKN